MAKLKKEKMLKLNWWQAGLFKSSTVSLGIILGVTFQDFLMNLLPFFWILFLGLGIYVASLWLKD